MKNPSVHDVPFIFWIVLAIVMLVQSTWLFIDARKRDSYPWVWGIWGLFSFPLPTLLYFIFVRKLFRKRK